MKQPPKGEHLNTYTHALGILLALIGSPFLLSEAQKTGQSILFWGAALYSLSLLMVFTSSTLYHWSHSPSKKKMLRKWDHVSIYFLIAGTYTPFLFYSYLNHAVASTFIYIIWSLAIAGSLYKLFAFGKEWISILFYVAMGWMAVFFGKDFFNALPDVVVKWIVAGGVLYSIGVVFYAFKRIPFNHAIWHVFVMAAAGCHFWGVYQLMLKTTPLAPMVQ